MPIIVKYSLHFSSILSKFSHMPTESTPKNTARDFLITHLIPIKFPSIIYKAHACGYIYKRGFFRLSAAADRGKNRYISTMLYTKISFLVKSGQKLALKTLNS